MVNIITAIINSFIYEKFLYMKIAYAPHIYCTYFYLAHYLWELGLIFFSLNLNYVFCKEQQCRNDNFGLLFNY